MNFSWLLALIPSKTDGGSSSQIEKLNVELRSLTVWEGSLQL